MFEARLERGAVAFPGAGVVGGWCCDGGRSKTPKARAPGVKHARLAVARALRGVPVQPHHLTLCAVMRVDGLADRERLREALPLLVCAQVSDHPPSILKPADQSVDRALPAEGYDVRAGLADPQTLARPGHAGNGSVPRLAHEPATLAPGVDVVPGAAPSVRAQAVGWICDDGIYAGVRESAEPVEAVALLDVPGPHRRASLISMADSSISRPHDPHRLSHWAAFSRQTLAQWMHLASRERSR